MNNCPKCLHELHLQTEICPHCGFVFEKYLKYHPEQVDRESAPTVTVTLYKENDANPLAQLLFHESQQRTLPYLIR